MERSVVEGLTRRAAERSARSPVTIVYPEAQDERIRQAAERVARAGIARSILSGPADTLPDPPPPGVGLAPVEDAERLDALTAAYVQRRGVAERIARRLVRKPLVHAATMVAAGMADGMVAGATHATGAVIQAAGLAVGYAPGVRSASSCFIMVLPRLGDRRDVPLVFADCAVNPDPSPEDLAATAVVAAGAARSLLGLEPRVAMLSFSTHGSAQHPKVEMVRRATELAAARLTDGVVEGELQFDAAVVPAVAARKAPPGSPVAGRANVLVFPDLNAGNIAYKAVQQLAGALAVGPVMLGFAKPVNDLSRAAQVDEIVAITAVTVLQAGPA